MTEESAMENICGHETRCSLESEPSQSKGYIGSSPEADIHTCKPSSSEAENCAASRNTSEACSSTLILKTIFLGGEVARNTQIWMESPTTKLDCWPKSHAGAVWLSICWTAVVVELTVSDTDKHTATAMAS
eukprot:CAMPEP_0194510340 /NCGR_PEP_ID=MMETSP0253-20130528/41642_1 /TAXON_ID=2966 /ORGANISM="Noctiluca scintillans" /LENGTH=130 /DNA_ID=CAMNT_0039353569 /DNA_START=471 /DNA_END=860 /DNA_ORIENTATION=+